MRWIVISLLIVNLLVLLWRALPDTRPAPAAPVRSTVPGAESLQLAGTREAASDAGRAANASVVVESQPSAPEAGQLDVRPQEGSSPESHAQQSNPQQSNPADIAGADGRLPDTGVPEMSRTQPAPVAGAANSDAQKAAATVQPAAQKLAEQQSAPQPATRQAGSPQSASSPTLSPRTASAAPASVPEKADRSAGLPVQGQPTAMTPGKPAEASVAATPATTGAPTATAICRASPWTSDADALDKWGRALGEQLLTEAVRPLPPSLSWLVYIPGKASREATLARLRELKGLKLESAFLNSGEQQGGISLGLFSKRESAERRLAEARSLGVTDARLLERRRERQESRLLTRSSTGVAAGWEEISCENVAPADIAH